MSPSPLTAYVIARYRFRPCYATIVAMAAELHWSTNAVYSRLWRAGVVHAEKRAMFHSDDVVILAYLRLGTLVSTASELGMAFYTVKSVLARHGYLPRRWSRGPKVPLVRVQALIQRCRAEGVQWKDIAFRLGVSRDRLWRYRKQLSGSQVEGADEGSRGPCNGAA